MKINNKIIRLKRFAKSICYCERSAAILIAMTIILSLFLVAVPMAGIAEATDYYVDPIGTDDTNHGTSSGTDAFKTIQYAINDSRVVTGDTINVAAGIYNEQVVIDKALTLQGDGETTIIKPTALTAYVPASGGGSALTGIVFVNNAGGSVTVKNLKVDAASLSADTAIWFSGVAAPDFAGVYFYDTDGTIDAVTSVNSNHLTTTGYNINGFFVNSTNNTISVEIKNSKTEDILNTGIVIGDAYTSTNNYKIMANIHNNTTIGDGPSTHINNGIMVRRNVTLIAASYNTVSDVSYLTNYGTGIYLRGALGSPVVESNIISNSDTGINIEDVSNLTIRNNTINGFTANEWGCGISIIADQNDMTSILVSGNTSTGPQNYAGISLSTYSNSISALTISDNTLTGNGSPGAGILDDSGLITATLSGNTISGWTDGIRFDNVASADLYTISDNNISGNTYGLKNESTNEADATNNWWGNASGPTHTSNPNGTGDAVSDNVGYAPWYTDEEKTTLSNAIATLSDLTVDGTTITGFDSATLIYNKVLPYGTTEVPEVGATPTDSNATKVITQAANLTGTEAQRTATVVVTAKDGTTTKTYKVIFGSIKVTITKTGPATANQGNNIIYTITYKNVGTFDATNVVITETYPSEVEYVSATPAPNIGNNQWNIGNLAPGAEGTITVTVHVK